ncbi:RNA 2',3'-cyclic phosphodiesterase [Sphingomonas sp.]|jgi:2'-5' RNA ligase|uniref:RNA 2',3'-cyclic phosphodiesterase n=1 Tax=Sphingomonas sp. TaxID=28214 RepID=UPI002ED807FB
MRLFVALQPPLQIRDLLADAMEGIAAVRWQDDEQLHLTLRFIGDVERTQAEDVAAALDPVRAPVPEVALAGVGRFKDTLWAAVTPHEALAALHRKVDHACVRAGLPPERRAYLPHITLARFARSAGSDPAIARWLADHAGLASERFALPHLILYQSILGHGGASYDALARWPLGTG